MAKIRVNELEHARQGALEVAARSARENRPGYITGRVVDMDEEDSRRLVVDFGGSHISVLAGPGRWVPGSLVAVDVDGQNRPTRVRGAVTDVPAEHVNGEPVEPVVPVVSWAGSVLEPREITAEERARIEETALGLETAQQELADARTEAEQSFGELDDKLGQAAGVADQAVLDARDAHNAAVAAQQAADAAAAQYGELDERTLDAQAAAQAAQEAADAAQEAADAAHTALAGKADQGEVTRVEGLLNGKNSVTISTSGPSTSTPGIVAGDVWWQRDAGNNIYGQWTWDGTAWVASLIRNELVASLDVHKLQVTGSAKIADAVVNKLWVDGLAARTGTFNRVTIAAGNLFPDPQFRDADAWRPHVYSPTPGYGFDHPYMVVEANGINQLGDYYYNSDSSKWRVPLEPGRVYELSMLTRFGSTADLQGLSVFVKGLDKDGSQKIVQAGRLPRTSANSYAVGWETTQFTAPDWVHDKTTLGFYTERTDKSGVCAIFEVRLRPAADARLIVDGAVTARTLNVVPEQGSGGLQLTPDGMMVLEADGSGSVDLRVGTDNYLSFYRDNAVNFSVSADGALTAQAVAANANLLYRGTELSDLLAGFPRGVVYHAEKIDGTFTIQVASYTSRIGHILVQRPASPRFWRVVARAGIQSTASDGSVTSGAHWQFVSNSGFWYNENAWQTHASAMFQTSGYYWQTETLEEIVHTDDIQWDENGTALVSWTARNSKGAAYKIGQGMRFYIEDVGPAIDMSPTYPWIRPEAPEDTGSSTTPQPAIKTWASSGFQNYRSGVRLNHASGNLAGGNYGGEWRGVMLFPHASIASALSGATINKVEAYLQNAHTYAYSGSTVLIGSHNYASAPASSPAVAARTSQHFSRGQGRWVTLPNAVGDGFKNGTIKGLVVYGGSTSNYATWTPGAVKLRVSYKK